MTIEVTPALERMFEAIRTVLNGGDGSLEHWCSPAVRGGLESALRAAMADSDLLPPSMLGEPRRFGFATYRLHTEPDFTVFSSVTAPGSWPPVHSHGSWGLVGLYRGTEEEICFEVANGSEEGGGALTETSRATLHEGDVVVIGPPPADVHQVLNRGDANSVGIHLFRHDLVAKGFVLYPPPDFEPVPTGPLAYDAVLGGAG